MLAYLDSDPLLWLFAGFVVVALHHIQSRVRFAAYDSIPTVGYSSPLLSYITAFQFFFSPNRFIEEGYAKYRDGAFKVAYFDSWRVVLSGPKLIDELKHAKDNELSFAEAVAMTLQQRHTMGEEIMMNAYHITIVRNELTKNLDKILPDIHDELEHCFTDLIPESDDWVSHKVMEKVAQIVARASGRIFVGVPVCRNDEYLDTSIAYTMKIVISGKILSMFPSFLRGLVAKALATRKTSVSQILKHVSPIIEERRKDMELYGDDWADKPNDMIQWILDSPQGQAETIPQLAQRLLALNFASIHTSSMSFTTVIFRLAANPEYLHPLREEAATIIGEYGWTKVAMQKMRKADSFFKECQRLHGFNTLGMERLALKDYMFKDGTFIPKGTFVCIAQRVAQMEPDYYDDPSTFDPWRSSRVPEEDGNTSKHLATTANPGYMPFGVGKHACPGRFFAVAELKAVLAWLVLHYDLKMENEGVFPEPSYYQARCPPSSSAKALFRKRKDKL
ncbi:cytochrome P450 [Irpex rosettiformis]|uniref:Cytochrome P450 n=1 Tax=Irpex rosettiformis TaxID=378272 RepID=A0ACB8TRD9_9APHY|nr:cytochrome P450 [Irpex rosettiformis]